VAACDDDSVLCHCFEYPVITKKKMDGCKLNINLSTQINKIGHHFVIAKNGRYILELYLAVATYKIDVFC
jgi:hypothetical protein